jgi:hypothetical protein
MRAYYVDPGSSKYQVGKIVAIDVAKMSLNLVLVGLRLGLKNRQVGEKWVADDYSYLSVYKYISCTIRQ